MSVIGSSALRFDDEQAMLLDYARSFCRDHGGSARARERLETELAHGPELWDQIVQMGWTGIGLPEAFGGSGLGIGAAVAVLESMGRELLGTPLMSTLLAGQLLLRAGTEAQAELLQQIALGTPVAVADLESEDFTACGDTIVDQQQRVTGSKRLVMDAAGAEWFLITARRDNEPVLAVLRRDTLSAGALRPATLIDLTHRAADLDLHSLPAEMLLTGERVAVALRDYRLLGALMVAAESAGAAAACLDTLVDYLKTRKQFGRLIGSYQALKHPAVDLLTGIDSARSFIYHAATLLSEERLDHDAEVACRMAKAQATDTLCHAGDRAVQFHGGMGFTWDCDAQLYLRKAQWAQQQFGDAQHHRQVLAALLLDES